LNVLKPLEYLKFRGPLSEGSNVAPGSLARHSSLIQRSKSSGHPPADGKDNLQNSEPPRWEALRYTSAIRGLIVYRTIIVVCVLLAFSFTPAVSGTSRAKYQSGTLLEVVDYDWCHHDCAPFNTDSALICVQVAGRTLVGDRKLGHDWKSYYPQLSDGQGKPLTVRFDSESMWVMTAGGKEFHFDQRYDEDLMHMPVCTAEIHRHMLKSLGAIARPPSIPSDAVLIPEGDRFFRHYYSWVSCSFDPSEGDNICTYWDKAGRKDYESHVVSDKDRKPVPQADLQVDPYTTRRNEVHLQNGVALVSDGRARINGKLLKDKP
jgi:hypothetical protein